MNIDFFDLTSPTFIRAYLESKFRKNFKISSDGRELIANSPFNPGDKNNHFSINLETGNWRVFGETIGGNFTKLYSLLENIPYSKAQTMILFKTMFKPTVNVEVKKLSNRYSVLEELNSFTPITLDSGHSEDAKVFEAWSYLFGRNLLQETSDKKWYLATKGLFRDRIIIPYEDYSGVFFFQGRSLSNNHKPKYLNPTSEYGVNTTNIVYPFKSNPCHFLVICEGPIDAISLQLQGVNATCINGCHIGETQMKIFKKVEGVLIVAFDNDEAGHKGLKSAESLRKQLRMPKLHYCFPPKGFKDWNEFYVKGGEGDYIYHNHKEYDEFEVSATC